ncbi:alanine racemase [Microbacterium phyllosphaerae]|uniref:Alanine racemase n=1 Tax=Microbacterium phyllosphaerae TaxID=124798 RepID=A0ABS4WRR6_9MICO|nr:alanine racemase [Microbacterium phyllosphaerae]MBP2378912.1 alanine racemase [Microbacterium phyllosphaerae]
MTRPELRIRTDRFVSNIAAVRERIAPSTLMVVLKDDAYGHGLRWAVDAATEAGVEWYGSYDVGSGVEARRVLGDTGRILAWVTSTDAEIDDALHDRIDLGVGSAEYLTRIVTRARAQGVRARVHLKIDTGLHRNGLLPEEWEQTIADVRAAEAAGHLELAGIWSHLAEASDAEDDDAQAVFLEAVRVAESSGPTPEALHLTASAASWWRPELRGSVSRIGAFCYGVRSADGPELDGVLPVAELIATVVTVRDDEAVIAIGSFDGIPSTLAGSHVGTTAGARELRRIDATTAVVAGWPGMRAGDPVWLFGAGEHGESSATTLAERIDTVGEEILTRLTSRVRRVVVA